MKLHKLSIANFKFHHKLEVVFNGKNTLIYGENGVGKSSIYEALNVNLHPFSVSRDIDVNELYKNRDHFENMQVDLFFDEELSLSIRREQNSLENPLEYYSILANEKKFNTLLDSDFYLYLNDTLQVDFSYLSPLVNIYKALEIDFIRNITYENTAEYIAKRIESDKKFETLFHQLISENKINNILETHFKENFKIKFNIKASEITDLKLTLPTIYISIVDIDDRGNFHEHFNEAKRKLISIAIYFSLAKKQEGHLSKAKEETKLLILDDFLTSLDMGNRKLIVQYLLENFRDYQIIILTHNIQFSNLMIKLIYSKDESKNWDFKNIFSTINSSVYESIIYDRETNYIKAAEDNIKTNQLEHSANLLRKEFERITEELRIITEIGAKEKLSNIINQLLTLETSTDINIKKMQNILQKTNYYKDTIMNSAAHDNQETEIYEKECIGAITVLKQLDKYIKILKKGK